MASTSQSLRFSSGAAAAAAAAASGAGGGSFDALNRILGDLCTRDNPKVSNFFSPLSVWLPGKKLDQTKWTR